MQIDEPDMNDAMKIKMIFHGSLKKYNNDVAETDLEIPDGTIVSGIIGRIGVPKEEIAFVAVNGSRVPVSQILQDGDKVKFFQMVGGG
jgi:sulfur carrier protein ThiS